MPQFPSAREAYHRKEGCRQQIRTWTLHDRHDRFHQLPDSCDELLAVMVFNTVGRLSGDYGKKSKLNFSVCWIFGDFGTCVIVVLLSFAGWCYHYGTGPCFANLLESQTLGIVYFFVA